MEKLVYVLWRRSGTTPAAFSETLRGPVADALGAAGATRIAVNAVDDAVAGKQVHRIGALEPPLDGMLSLWLECADEPDAVEEALSAAADRIAGYRVVESVPIVNTERAAAPGERTPGINMVTCIERPTRMTPEAWRHHWHGHHKRVALETQCTYAYVRNEVVHPVTPEAPAWSGIVEEGFPAEAVGDPMVWYRADGDPAVLKRNLDRMLESCRAFLDLDRVVSTPMSEYRLGS